MKNITEEYIIKQVKQFCQVHPNFGFTTTELNIERFAEDLVKKINYTRCCTELCEHNYIDLDDNTFQCTKCFDEIVHS